MAERFMLVLFPVSVMVFCMLPPLPVKSAQSIQSRRHESVLVGQVFWVKCEGPACGQAFFSDFNVIRRVKDRSWENELAAVWIGREAIQFSGWAASRSACLIICEVRSFVPEGRRARRQSLREPTFEA